jgi:heat shock protein HslJ
MGISTEAADTKPFIHFTDSGTIDGHTSVNTFFGQYTVNEDSIFFDQVGSTMRMGEDMEIEVAVMEALGMCTTLDVQDSAIYASDIFGNNVMVLKRQSFLPNQVNHFQTFTCPFICAKHLFSVQEKGFFYTFSL